MKGRLVGAKKGFDLLKKKADALKARLQALLRKVYMTPPQFSSPKRLQTQLDCVLYISDCRDEASDGRVDEGGLVRAH